MEQQYLENNIPPTQIDFSDLIPQKSRFEKTDNVYFQPLITFHLLLTKKKGQENRTGSSPYIIEIEGFQVVAGIRADAMEAEVQLCKSLRYTQNWLN